MYCDLNVLDSIIFIAQMCLHQYFSHIFSFGSQVASSTPWCCHKTFTSRMILLRSTFSLVSRILTGYSSYVTPSWTSISSKFTIGIASDRHFLNIDTWNTSCTSDHCAGNRNRYVALPTSLITSNGPIYLDANFPFLPI